MHPSPALRAPRAILGVVATALLVGGCAVPVPSSPTSADPSVRPPIAAATPTATANPEPSAVTSTPTPTPTANAAGFTLSLEPIASGLDNPVDLAVRPGEPDALYVVEQAGRIQVVRDGTVGPEPVLDIAGTVTAGGEQGLLGLAFHPDLADGRLFVYYTALDGQQVVSSFRIDPEAPDRALRGSEQILLRMADPANNHNGGGLVFGPDGYLYASTGDGGGGGDPLDSGRRLDTLLAKILRIDVDGGNPDGVAYGIPDDNPFVDTAGAMPEIWHTGLRNPWRIRFDRRPGDLLDRRRRPGAWEEIDRAPAGVGGLDFGWNRDGGHALLPADADDCDDPGFTAPVTEYGHDEGCSVTGGTVYRGEAQPALDRLVRVQRLLLGSVLDGRRGQGCRRLPGSHLRARLGAEHQRDRRGRCRRAHRHGPQLRRAPAPGGDIGLNSRAQTPQRVR